MALQPLEEALADYWLNSAHDYPMEAATTSLVERGYSVGMDSCWECACDGSLILPVPDKCPVLAIFRSIHAVGQPGHAVLPGDGGGTAGPRWSYRERGESQLLCTDMLFCDCNRCDLGLVISPWWIVMSSGR